MFPASLLRSSRDDLARILDGFDELVSLGKIVSHRLFDVDVLACRDGLNRHRRVPVVRGAEHDGVNVFARENVTVVLERLGRSAKLFCRLLAPWYVDVGYAPYFSSCNLRDIGRHAASASAAADQSDADAIVRSENALGCQRCHGAGSKKISSLHGFDLLRMTWKRINQCRRLTLPLSSFWLECTLVCWGNTIAGNLVVLFGWAGSVLHVGCTKCTKMSSAGRRA